MGDVQRSPSKAPFVIIVIVLILALIGYGVWLVISSRNKTGFFKDYTPNLGPGLIPVVPFTQLQPLTDAAKATRAKLISNAQQNIG
jgi:hypothetical protein